MLINTAFSHIRKSAPHISWLLLTKPKQVMISMGLCKKDIANALKYVFLTPSHPYKECHLWITTPPHPPHPPHPPPHQPLIISFNAMKSIWQCLKLFFYQWSMYWAYNITLYCTATYREYHIGTVKFVIHNHFRHFQYLHRLLKSSLRCPVTQRCSLDMSLILSCSSMPCSDYLKMVGMDKYSTLKR